MDRSIEDMAKEYKGLLPAHNSIYRDNFENKNYESRDIRVEYCLPEKGVNSETGVLLFICGYGADIDSNVYVKMRHLFADQYNLVTIQCEYFGCKYMHSNFAEYFNDKINKDKLYSEKEVSYEVRFKEELGDFNDMGIMQAIDNITATIGVMGILKQQGLVFDTNKVSIYGHSQGGYLAYLCNRFAPGLFHLIIDNSAWDIPTYLNESRGLLVGIESIGQKLLNILYLITIDNSVRISNRIYDLNYLYKDFQNDCQVISCHGVDDKLVTIEAKRRLLDSIDNMMLMEIEKEDVDGVLFNSSGHGLGADFLKLFDLIYCEYTPKYTTDFNFSKPDNVHIVLEDEKTLEIRYQNHNYMPIILMK